MSTIRLQTADCVRKFQALFAALSTSTSDIEHLIDAEALDDEFGRFRVWIGNIGALQKGHSSLDYRLRDSPLLSSNVSKLLSELSANFTEAIAVVSGSRTPYEQQAQSLQDDQDDDDFFSEDEDDSSDEGAPKTELQQRFLELVDILDNLYKLSVRIRSPTLRSRPLKAASFRPIDSETGVDLLEKYADYDRQYVRELLSFLRISHAEGAEGESEFLDERLSRSITMRRRQFKYFRRHRDKLARSALPDDAPLDATPHDQRPEAPLRHDTLEVQPGLPVMAAIKDAVSEKTPRTVLSGTEATHHHKSLDELVDTKSVTSYAETVRDLAGKGLELPPPPKAAEGDKDFECPYCFVICPARYGRGRGWRTHLLQDLQPYICTYRDCGNKDQLFRSRREWSEHESSHRKVWRCPQHPDAVFRTESGLEAHLRQHHLSHFPEHQLASIIKVGETSAMDQRLQCPICFADANMEGGLQNHIANHLERIASFALPKDVDTMDDETDGASSVASRGRSLSTGSSQSVSTTSRSSNLAMQEDQSTSPVASENSRQGEQTEVPGPVLGSGTALSAALLENLPDSSLKRLDLLLPHQEWPEQSETSMQLAEELATIDPEALQKDEDANVEALRKHFLSLPGCQSVRFLKRSSWWRGYANFELSTAAASALIAFDHERFPDVKIRQGVETKSALRFSFPQVSDSGKGQEGTHTSVPLDKDQASGSDVDDSTTSRSLSHQASTDHKPRPPVISDKDLEPFTLHTLYRSLRLRQRDQSYAPNDKYNSILHLMRYDITRLDAQAIVNSANRSMKISRNSDSLNHCIHKAAGPGLEKECNTLKRIQVGEVRVTGGYELPAEYIIHASRPQYSGINNTTNHEKLATCYRESLRTAMQRGFRSIAFPTLGAGGCGFPARMAARIALQEVRAFLDVYQKHPLERIIFCVHSQVDYKAYQDFLPVYFPPTHGDLEHATPSERAVDYSSFAAEVESIYPQLESIGQNLIGFSKDIPHFPTTVIVELAAIASTLRSLREVFDTPDKITSMDGKFKSDFDLICFVLQSLSGGLVEILEQNLGLTRQAIWEGYHSHLMIAQGIGLQELLEACQDFVKCLEDIIVRDGIRSPDMEGMRRKLQKYRRKQAGQKDKEKRDRFDEVLLTREYHAMPATKAYNNTIKAHQISPLSRLYQLGELGAKDTNAIPNSRFNDIVCLFREDITKLEVDVIVNSTDRRFSGMGTLDRTIFRKGGLELQEQCAAFGTCKDGDVRMTSGYSLPCKHIVHTIPPESYMKGTKDVLRKMYREALHMAASVKASSMAIPTIGTGMLNYPRRDCAHLAMMEVKQFLETFEDTTLEKIIFCVFGETDEFIYQSAAPTIFPPIDLNTDRTHRPGSHSSRHSPSPKNVASSTPEAPPKRTLFGSIGEALRNVRLGSSLSKRQNTQSGSSRPIDRAEEHCLTNFEAHARNCAICSDIPKLCIQGHDLCADGYANAQALLQFLKMSPDQSVYSTQQERRQREKVEIPEEYIHAMALLSTMEKTSRDPLRIKPFVSLTSSPYQTQLGRGSQQGVQEPVAPSFEVYNDDIEIPAGSETTTAIAEIYTWVDVEEKWSKLGVEECFISIHPGKVEIYDISAQEKAQEALLSLELTLHVNITKNSRLEVLLATAQDESFKFQTATSAQCERLFQRLRQARNGTPASSPPVKVGPESINATSERYLVGKAVASVFTWTQDGNWESLRSTDLNVYVYLGQLAGYVTDPPPISQQPIFKQDLDNVIAIEKTSDKEVSIRSRSSNDATGPPEAYLYRCASASESDNFHDLIMRSQLQNRFGNALGNAFAKRPELQFAFDTDQFSKEHLTDEESKQSNPIYSSRHPTDLIHDLDEEVSVRSHYGEQLLGKTTAKICKWTEDGFWTSMMESAIFGIRVYPGSLEVYKEQEPGPFQRAAWTQVINEVMIIKRESDLDVSIRLPYPHDRDRYIRGYMYTSSSAADCDKLYRLVKVSQIQQRQRDSASRQPEVERNVRSSADNPPISPLVRTAADEGLGSPDLPSTPSHQPSSTPKEDSLDWSASMLKAQNQLAREGLPTGRHRQDYLHSLAEGFYNERLEAQARHGDETANKLHLTHSRDPSSQFDLSISGLSSVNIDEYYSYLDLASTEPDQVQQARTSQKVRRSSRSRAMSLPDIQRPPISSSVHEQKGDYDIEKEEEDDVESGVRHPRPTTPEPSHVKTIPPNARWTKIDRRLVSPQALEEANERFEEREDYVVVLRVLSRDEIQKLADRSREFRRGRVVVKEPFSRVDM